MLLLRQGDVLLRETNAATGKKVPTGSDGKTILALGEVTGHHHRFGTPEVQLFRDDGPSGRSIVVVAAPADLVHEEHSTIRVPSGRYEQLQQVEYTPAELRRVAD